jgi:hypothetical protein
LAFTELSNGFGACVDPERLQAICDRLGPATINVFVQRWLACLPLPLGEADRDGGYWWECSMRQVEVSRIIVFDAPRHARGFFEALIADNLDLGRPANVEIIFGRRIRRDTKGVFRTAIDRRDNQGVVVNVFSKHSRIKQYLNHGRAMRIETVVNAPRDLGCNARLPNLEELQARARACNRRILDAERVGQGCALASPAFERIARPTVDAEGQRTPALRFGDPRVMALVGALSTTLLAATGFTNKRLRALVAELLGTPYRPGQMTYDLRRLRRHGLIRRIPRTNRYVLTPTACGSRSSTPRSITGCCARCWPPTSPKPHPTFAMPCASSTATSRTTPPTPGSAAPHENLTQTSRSQRPRIATPLPRLRSEPVAPDGAVVVTGWRWVAVTLPGHD